MSVPPLLYAIPVPKYKRRYLVMVGDGLSILRILQFRERIAPNHLHKFVENYEQVKEIRKALARIVVVPGDLHLGGFHFLQSVYDFFSGGFLQPMHALLGWKRLRHTDVSQTYFVADDLAELVFEQVQLFLYKRSLKERLKLSLHDAISIKNVKGKLKKPWRLLNLTLMILAKGTPRFFACLPILTG